MLKCSVFMCLNGHWTNGALEIPTFVKTQVESLRSAGLQVLMDVVDDRTSVHGILRNIRRLRKHVAQVKPGLVHAQYGSVTAEVANLARRSLPLIVSFCGEDLLGTPNPGLVWRLRERCARAIGLWAARRAAAIIVKSNNLLQALSPNLRDKAIVLPNGVDTNSFRPMARDDCRARLGWDKQSKVVLFNASRNASRTENQHRKNSALARATIDLLAKSIPDVSLYMVSNATHKEMPLIMNAADCLLVTSLHEGSPNIVKEAMACNLPVVAVPCGDVIERLSLTRPGAIRPYDTAALAAAVREILEVGCRSNGREQLITQGLTTTSIANRLIQIYRHVHERNSTPSRKWV
jgi:teichuronic acid biosynthesis glycosyltransferase TuaC